MGYKKNWPFNTGDCLVQAAFMTSLTVLRPPLGLSTLGEENEETNKLNLANKVFN